MRRVLIGFMALLLSSGLGFAQAEKGKGKGKEGHAAHASADAAVKDAVKKMETELRVGNLKGDASASEKYLADDFHGISGVSGQAYDKKEIVDRINSGKNKYSQINVTNDDVVMYGPDVAVSHGMADVKMTIDGKDASGRYHYARTWVKRGGSWKSVWFQTSKVQ